MYGKYIFIYALIGGLIGVFTINVEAQYEADTSQSKPASPLRDVLNQNKADFTQGKVYQLTGFAADSSQQQKVFQGFAYTKVRTLASSSLDSLNILFLDDSYCENSDWVNHCMFVPQFGMELTNAQGEVERYLLGGACATLRKTINGKLSECMMKKREADWLKQLLKRGLQSPAQPSTKPTTPPKDSTSTTNQPVMAEMERLPSMELDWLGPIVPVEKEVQPLIYQYEGDYTPVVDWNIDFTEKH